MTLAADVLGKLGSTTAYAVLDPARDPRVVQLTKGQLVRCLWRGELPREVSEVAPHVMRVWAGNEPSERFFKQGWHGAWGVVVTHAGPLKSLWVHLRKALRVRTEDGRYFAFRWYDPRVLRVYLPTCTTEELETFFGPVEAFAVEDEAQGAFHVFRRAVSGFEHRHVSAQDPWRLVRAWEG